MLRISFFTVILISVLLGIGCTSGNWSLKKGKYDLAVAQASHRLTQNANHAKAIAVLQTAYPLAVGVHQRKIDEALQSPNPLKWEVVLAEYEQIERLDEQVLQCNTCKKILVIDDSAAFNIQNAKQQAADFRYQRGVQLLGEQSKVSAKAAYFDFQKALELIPNYLDAYQKKEDAYWLAALKVKVEPLQVGYQQSSIDISFLENELISYMHKYEQDSFIKFYHANDTLRVGSVPDQILYLSLDDFYVGQPYIRHYTSYLSKNNIVVGYNKDRTPIYASARARFTKCEKTVSTSARLRLKVVDNLTDKTLEEDKLYSSYLWENAWGYYDGDSRALGLEHSYWLSKREQYPPSPQDFFVQLSRVICQQFGVKIKNFYNNY